MWIRKTGSTSNFDCRPIGALPNFSFLMADDMRRRVSTLDWVEGVSGVLGEHMYADKINAGLAKVFPFRRPSVWKLTEVWIELRRTFLVKAFQRRQVALLQPPCGSGLPAGTIVSLTLTA